MPDFISGIHNYCDRWCERCTFTARCRVADAESDMPDEELDIHNQAFWRRLASVFAESQMTLKEKAEEFGIDLDAVSDEEFAVVREREDEFIENDNLTKLADRYRKGAKTILENKSDWLIFSALDENAQNEMLEIIYWYQFFISAKIRRGLHGLLDYEGKYDEEELNDPQSDANGSVKTALIAVTRSIMAWTALMTKENSQTIKPLLHLLETIKQTAEKNFPDARDFVRPGFDQIETVM